MSDDQLKQPEGTTTPKRSLGISKDVTGGSTVSIPAPYKLERPTPEFTTGYHFPVAKLVQVFCTPQKDTKTGPKDVLSFIFKDDKGRQSTHMEFPIDEDDAKFESKLEWLHQRIKHIWDETIGESLFPQEGLGQNAETFLDLFTKVADAFNGVTTGEGTTAQKVYSKNLVYLKLTYNKERLNFPLFPNFLQKATLAGKPVPVTLLEIKPSRDKVEISSSSSTASYGGGAETSFGAASAGYNEGDYPDV